MTGLFTLWSNTGTLCNLAYESCYIESSPTNDALAYITLAEVREFLDEIARDALPTREIAFTGGEPFMNYDIVPINQLCLDRRLLVLSNATRPMRRFERELLALEGREQLMVRVSLDHHTKEIDEAERGADSWDKAIDGLVWLAENGSALRPQAATWVLKQMLARVTAACTLLPYQADFDLGATLAEAARDVQLNHPHCARSCVLGGASCSA